MTASPSAEDIRVLIVADASRVGPLVEALATQEDIRIVGIASAPPQADDWEPTVGQARKAVPHSRRSRATTRSPARCGWS